MGKSILNNEDPYDDDMYEGHDLPDKLQDICDSLDIRNDVRIDVRDDSDLGLRKVEVGKGVNTVNGIIGCVIIDMIQVCSSGYDAIMVCSQWTDRRVVFRCKGCGRDAARLLWHVLDVRQLWVVEGLTLERCSTFGKKDKLENLHRCVGPCEILRMDWAFSSLRFCLMST
ncbi:hypothetical protein Tco_1226778 [Tanacetum coccineum]